MGTPAIHPGEHLAEELRALDMSASTLARQLSVPTNRITEILNGRRAITGDTALRLAHFFGTSAEFWLNLQKLYELRLAEDRVGDDIDSLPTLKSYDSGTLVSPWHEVVQLRGDLKSGELVAGGVCRRPVRRGDAEGAQAGIRATGSVLCAHLPDPQSARTGQGRGPSPGRAQRQGVPQAGRQLRRRQDAHADRAPASGT